MKNKACRMIAVIVLVLQLYAVCIVLENKAIAMNVPKQDIKVTFIELGSVGCIPCRMMQPIMSDIGKEYKNAVKVVFYDVRTSDGKPYAEKYKVNMIPTQVFLDKKGSEYYRHVGYFSKNELVKILRLKGVK